MNIENNRPYLINSAKELGIKIDKRQTTKNIYLTIIDEVSELYLV